MTGFSEGPPPGQWTGMPPGGRMQPHRGAVVLTLGIVGIVMCGIPGIVAWVMGNNDLAEMKAGRMDPSGRGLTSAGRVLGIISLISSITIWVLAVLVALLWNHFASPSGYNPGW